MFNPVAPYGYLLSDMYLFMADITNPAWIGLDITRFCEQQRQPSNVSAWPACPKKIGRTLLGAGGFDTICTAVCVHCDRSTACRLCHLEPSLSSL